MMRRLVPLTIAVFCCVSSFSQKATLNGYISDKKTGERLLGASIFILNKNLGTTSNSFGFYSITIPQDSIEVSFSYTGYAPFIKTVLLNADMTLDVALEPSQELAGVVVKATRKETIQNRTQMSSIELPV